MQVYVLLCFNKTSVLNWFSINERIIGKVFKFIEMIVSTQFVGLSENLFALFVFCF